MVLLYIVVDMFQTNRQDNIVKYFDAIIIHK